MKKNLILPMLLFLSINSYSQILGNLVSAFPNTASQGQTLITTITQQAGSYLLGSPPCDNSGIFLLQGTDTIFSNYYNWQGMDIVDVEFSIPAAASPGFYDVYLASAHYDWWWGSCTTLGYWVLNIGFEVTLNTNVNQNNLEEISPFFYPNPVGNKGILTCNNKERKMYSLSVMDSYGRKVYNAIVDTERIALNVEDFEAGVYYYRLERLENRFSYTGKFTVLE